MNGNANSAVMTADPVAIATVISGAAPSIMRWASAWGPSLCRATASSAVRERSARPWAAIAKPAAKYAAAAASTAGSWPPAGRHGCPGAGPNPRAASTAPAAARLRASWAALSATRCGGAFWAGCTASVTAARSRTATGQPQYSSAAKPVVTDRAGASIRDRPGITTGQISPATIIMATTQNTGCLTSTPAPRSRTAATRMAPVPAEVTTARWSHGGEPTRGPAYRVSLRSFMVSSRAAGASSGQGAPRLDALPHRVTANLHLPQPYAHYPLPRPSGRGQGRGSRGPVAEQHCEPLLAEDRHAERLRLVQLGARALPGDHEARLLRHRARHLPAELGDRLGGLVPAVAGEGAGEDDGQPGQRPAPSTLPGEARVSHADPGRPPLLHDRPVPVHGEPVGDRLGDLGDLHQRRGAGRRDRVQRAERRGERPRGGRPDVPDRQRHEHPPQ